MALHLGLQEYFKPFPVWKSEPIMAISLIIFMVISVLTKHMDQATNR